MERTAEDITAGCATVPVTMKVTATLDSLDREVGVCPLANALMTIEIFLVVQGKHRESGGLLAL